MKTSIDAALLDLELDLDRLPDLIRADDVAGFLPPHIRPALSRIARWLRSVGAREHPRNTNPGRPAFRLYSLRDHVRFASMTAAERADIYLDAAR